MHNKYTVGEPRFEAGNKMTVQKRKQLGKQASLYMKSSK